MLFSRQQAIARSAQVSPHISFTLQWRFADTWFSLTTVPAWFISSTAEAASSSLPLAQDVLCPWCKALLCNPHPSRAAALGAGANQALVSQKVACTLRGNTGIAYLLFLKRKLPETQALWSHPAQLCWSRPANSEFISAPCWGSGSQHAHKLTHSRVISADA